MVWLCLINKNKNKFLKKAFLFYALSSIPLALSYERFYGIATNQNKRPYQEDRFAVMPNIQSGGDFFGIYDGRF